MMIKKISFSLLVTMALLLYGCSSENQFIRFPGVYKMDIQQGNIFSQEKVNQLKPGMTKEQVAFIMGQPILMDAFNKDRWDYVYSFQPGHSKREQKTLSLLFKNNRLTRISGDIAPVAGKGK